MIRKINNISIRVNINHKYYYLLNNKTLIIIANNINILVNNKLDPKSFNKILK